jgi:hypothetical protein
MTTLKRHWAASVILALFVALGLVYSFMVPIFEAPDELYHYPFVAHLAQGGDLPVQRADQKQLWQQEGSQPPLYYVVAGLLTSWLRVDDLPIIYRLNPHARIGIPLAHDNKNIVVHTDRETWPWHGAILGIHLVRLFSLLLASGTVLCTYGIASAIFPRDRHLAVAAMAFNAFIPMFIFISASVNNDNLVIFLSSLTLFLLVRVIQRGASRSGIVLIGVIIGLACLAKLSALGLVPLAGLALLLGRLARRPNGAAANGSQDPANGQAAQAAGSQRAARLVAWLIDCMILCVPVIFIAGWWYVRNWQLYGDPTGLRAMLDIVGRRPTPPSLRELYGEFEGLRINFWGLFGVVNVLLRPTWIYRVLDLLSAVAIIGVPLWVWQRLRTGRPFPWSELLLLAIWTTGEFVLLIRWTAMTYASQGRLLFPSISAICLFLALGLTGWLPRRWQGRSAAALAVTFFALSMTAPFTSIGPAYARPAILSEADIPPSAQRFNATYGGIARLVAFEVDQRAVRPGEALPVILYWQALQPTSEDLSIFLQLVSENQVLGQVDSYPGGGAYPTSMWSAGDVIRDEYWLPVSVAPSGPVAAQLQAGLYRYQTQQRLPATDAAGQVVDPPVLTRVKIAVSTRPPTPKPSQALDANLNNQVRLIGYDLPLGAAQPGTEVPLTLYWRVTGELDRDYTVFVHLVDEHGVLSGQGDGPPLDNTYPTSFWSASEELADRHRLRVFGQAAPGAHQVVAGLYDPLTGQRLPLLDGQGKVIGDQVVVAAVEVASKP